MTADDAPPPAPDWPEAVALGDELPAVYEELRRIAGNYLRRERTGHTLQPTALVHEAYLRLNDQKNVHWKNRAQFLGIAAQMMRRILANYAASRATAKRAGGDKIALDDALDFF